MISPYCHPEHREGSDYTNAFRILHYVQNDTI